MAQDSSLGSKRHSDDSPLGSGERKRRKPVCPTPRLRMRAHTWILLAHLYIHCTGERKPALDASTIDEKADMKGPISTSNWVIPGKLIAGSYPGSQESEVKHRDTIAAIIDAGKEELNSRNSYCCFTKCNLHTITGF